MFHHVSLKKDGNWTQDDQDDASGIKFVIHAYPETPKSWPPLNFQHQEILDQDIGIGELWRNTCTSSACAKSHETATHIKALRD